MDTKEARILEVSLQLFLQHGYTKVTLSDIAQALGVSRPTVYSAFANKEAILLGLFERETSLYESRTAASMQLQKTLQERLQIAFDTWILQPFASVVDSKNGLDLVANCRTYAPAGYAAIYDRFEAQLTAILKTGLKKKAGGLSAGELARILRLATQGLKDTTTSLPDLRRMVKGLIAMSLATVEAS